MADLPGVSEPQPLTAVQVGFGLVFLAGFFAMKLGTYLRFPWLYVKLMNLTQPFKNSVLSPKTRIL
jgi:NAD(P)H-quinone oxidoreductase subunit 5